MSIQALVELLQSLAKQMEDLWVERTALIWHLEQMGYPPEELERIRAEAKTDPGLRAQARAAYAQMRGSLDEAGTLAGIEALGDMPPPSGEPN